MQRLNECGQKISSKNFCEASNSTYVWETVLVKVHFQFYDWHLMKPPFRLQLAFAGDGIGITEVGQKGQWHRCTKYKSFQPPQNSDFTWPDYNRDNQWSRSEMSVGPQGVIRSVINASTEWISLLDDSKRGIVNLYNKIWTYCFLYYTYDASTEIKQTYDVGYEFIMQPVKINRIDYLTHLIERTRCGNECYDQDMYEYPCLSKDCILPGVYEDEVEYEIFDFKTLKTIKVKGKDLKKTLHDGTNGCIDVCVVGGQTCKCDCDKLEAEIATLTDQNKRLNQSIADLRKNNETLKEEVKDLTQKLNGAEAALHRTQVELRDCLDDKEKLENDLKTANQNLTECQTKLKECEEKCKERDSMDIKVILTKYLKMAITLTARKMETASVSSPSKQWISEWTNSFDKFSFTTPNEVTILNDLIRMWTRAADPIKPEIMIFANFLLILNLINDGQLGRVDFTVFDPEFILGRNVIYYEAISQKLFPLQLENAFTLGYILNWSPNSVPLFQKTPPKSSNDQERPKPDESATKEPEEDETTTTIDGESGESVEDQSAGGGRDGQEGMDTTTGTNVS